MIGADRGAVTDTVAAGVHQAAYHTGGSPVALQAGVLVPAAVGGGTWSAVSGKCVPGGTQRSWGEEALGGQARCHPDADEIGYVLFCRAEVWPPVVGVVPSGNADGDGELEARGGAEFYVDTAEVAFDGLGGYRQRLVALGTSRSSA